MENFVQINTVKRLLMNPAKTMKQGVKMFLLDSGPWPYIDKYYKFVSRKEGSDTPYFEC